MYLKNYQYLKNKETTIVALLVIVSFFIRIPVIFIFGDTVLENEWKIIVNNLIQYNEFSFRRFGDFFLPNLFMPPLYPLYLYFFSIFNLELQNYILLILSSQILMSSISVAVFYKINKLFFSRKISFYSSLLFSLFPLHLYACSQISSITLQIFLTILFFYFFFSFVKNRNLLSIFFISFISGCLILLRGEFIVIIISTLCYLFIVFKVSIKKILLILLITLLTISPYLIRNFVIFQTVTITKSFGYNLWKGNNPNSQVAGSELIEENLKKKIDKTYKDKFYQINLDKIFLNRAIDNITGNPTDYLMLFFKKFVSFLFIDINSSEKNYYHPLHYFPILLLGITSIMGIILSNKKSKHLNYLIFIFFINTFIFSSFFILARYKLIILPFQIIFTNIMIEYVKNKFFIRKNKNYFFNE